MIGNYLGITGLTFISNFISINKELELMRQIDSCPWSTDLKRRTQHYGFKYDYTNKHSLVPAQPIPDWLDDIIDIIMNLNIISNKPNQVIINEYMPGQGIHPHVDDVTLFGDGIVSISLGSNIQMDFINNTTRKSTETILTRRSLLCLTKQARYNWRHGITPRKKDNNRPRGRRVSITFRTTTSNKQLKCIE